MEISLITRRAEGYLEKLCNEIPNRRVGSEGNRQATAFFAETVKSFGFRVECPEFECMDWQSDGATVSAGERVFEVQASPYTPGIKLSAPLIVARSAGELESLDISNKILLMRGDLTKEQFLPKNFHFFQVEEQQRIIRLLEAKRPRAIITATTRNPEMAGALYPFPLFEDGDFDIPSAYMTEAQGGQLTGHEGEQVWLEIDAERISSRGCNVVARKGNDPKERIVLFAHIDAKAGTPGALDNGTGIVTLLLVAELLKDYAGDKTIEIVALNGEDYYSNPGEQLYLQQNEGRFDEIALGINIDGLGYINGRTAYSLYGIPQEIASSVKNVFEADERFVEGDAWFQGDHALFLMNGRPALALTSELVDELMSEIVHTDMDRPEIVDCARVAQAASKLHHLIVGVSASTKGKGES